MKCELSIKEFYDKYKDRYVFRIRKEKTIVYYKGIKAFELLEDKKKKIVTIEPSENTFKCNPTGMCNDKNNDYLQNLKELNRELKGEMNGIKFELAKKCDGEELLKGYKKFVEYCKNIWKIQQLFDYDIIEEELKDRINKLIKAEDKDKFLEENPVNIEFHMPLIKMDTIIDLQYHFYDCIRIKNKRCPTNRIRSTNFTSFNIIIDVQSLDDFINVCENAIDNYNGKGCVEKKYQHQFMLNGNRTSIFDKDKTMIAFEEEYPISKSEEKSKGRIDCVFYSVQDNDITDIYLIEIKVDDTVVLGDNGVLTHLDDIKNELNDEKKKKCFINRMYKNVCYSNKKIGEKELNLNYKVHFYTIFGYTEKNQYERIIETLGTLNNNDSIANYCERRILPKKYKDKTINDFVSKNNSYDIKFFIEEKMWQIDGAISNKFSDITKDIIKNNH